MAKIIGVENTSTEASVVLMEKDKGGVFTLLDETTLKLQSGEKSSAYGIIFDQFSDYITQNDVEAVCLKGSAVNRAGTKLVHLEGAELRGVLLAAAAKSGATVKVTLKAAASKTFGERKVDEYLKDSSFWSDIGLGDLKKGMREAAFSAINHFND